MIIHFYLNNFQKLILGLCKVLTVISQTVFNPSQTVRCDNLL